MPITSQNITLQIITQIENVTLKFGNERKSKAMNTDDRINKKNKN